MRGLMNIKRFILANLCLLLSFRLHAADTGSQVTSNRFQHIFTTAAYSAALGGAIGTAVLAFTPKPADNLRFIAIGASIGFMSGILLGGYLAFVPTVKKSPSVGAEGVAYQSSLGGQIPTNTLTVEAIFDEKSPRQTAWALHFPVIRLK